MKPLIGAAAFAWLSVAAVSTASAELKNEQQLLQENWFKCLSVFGETVAVTTEEPAETIANAALAACQDQEEVLAGFYNTKSPATAAYLIEELLPAQKEDFRQKLIAKVLAVKAAKRLQ